MTTIWPTDEGPTMELDGPTHGSASTGRLTAAGRELRNLDWPRAPEQVALCDVDAQVVQPDQCLVVFDPFGNRPTARIPGRDSRLP